MQRQGLAHLGLIRRVVQPHGFPFDHVSLIRHPADDLAPEPVVVLVFDSLAPTPGTVGSHEKHLARAESAGDQQW